MKNLLYLFFLLFSICNLSAQSDFNFNDNSEDFYQVLYTKEGPQLIFKENLELDVEEVKIVLTDLSTNKEVEFNLDDRGIVIDKMDYGKRYQIRLKAKADGQENRLFFNEIISTDFGSEIKVSGVLSKALDKWKGEEVNGVTIDTYLSEYKPSISKEVIDDFLIRFFKDNRYKKSDTSRDCNCVLTIHDDFINTVPELDDFTDLDYEDVYCGYFLRDRFKSTKGVLNNSKVAIKGRLKNSQAKTDSLNRFAGSSVVMKLICTSTEQCCPAKIDYGYRYRSLLKAEGFIDSWGNYNSNAIDLMISTVVRENGELIHSDYSAHAMNASESVIINKEYWKKVRDGVVPSLQLISLYFGDISFLDDLNLEGFENLIDVVYEAIIGSPFTQALTGGGISDVDKNKKLVFDIYPNTAIVGSILTSSSVSYTDTWGRKVLCNSGKVNASASTQNAFAMVVSMQSNNPDGECCYDDVAKWISGSYISEADKSANLSFAGTVIGCNGELDGQVWKYPDGSEIICENFNPILNGEYGVLGADGCERGQGEELSFSYECERGQTEIDLDGCINCSKVTINFEVDNCNSESEHLIEIIEYSSFSGLIIYDEYLNNCSGSATINLTPCNNYEIRHTIFNGNDIEVKTYTLFKACCPKVENRNETLGHEGITVYPTLVSNYLFAKNESNKRINASIVNMNGQVMESFNAIPLSEIKLDLSHLQTGLYMVRFEDGTSTKIVKN